MRLTTQSEQRCFRRCAREHYYAYQQRYRPTVEADTLRFGTLIHKALEAYWQPSPATPTPTTPRLERAMQALDAMAPEPFELALAQALMTGYAARWNEDDWEVLGVEIEFRAPLINPATGKPSKTFELGGKLDALVKAADSGLVYVCEHKTSSEDISAGSTYWQRLRIDTQVSTYYAGARALGHEVAGAIYDVVGKPGLKPLRATPIESRKYVQKTGALYANMRENDETPDEYYVRVLNHLGENVDRYYQRGTVVRLESEEREAAFDAWQTTRLVREAELGNRHPRNADACPRYGRMCSYFDVCTGAASIDDPTRFRRLETPHEELTADASTSTTAATHT